MQHPDIIQDYNQNGDISDLGVSLPPLELHQLPHCPQCGSLLRPAIVLYTEKLFEETENRIIDWFSEGEADLVLVIGTAAVVHPAAGYLERAIDGGAKVAVIDTRDPDRMADSSRFGDDHWYFQGDAAQVLPRLLRTVIALTGEESGAS